MAGGEAKECDCQLFIGIIVSTKSTPYTQADPEGGPGGQWTPLISYLVNVEMCLLPCTNEYVDPPKNTSGSALVTCLTLTNGGFPTTFGLLITSHYMNVPWQLCS